MGKRTARKATVKHDRELFIVEVGKLIRRTHTGVDRNGGGGKRDPRTYSATVLEIYPELPGFRTDGKSSEWAELVQAQQLTVDEWIDEEALGDEATPG